MLPYTVNSPRSYKGKSGKERRSSSVWCVGLLICLFAAAGGVWYLKAHSAYVRNLVAVITEHGENSLNCKIHIQLVCDLYSRCSRLSVGAKNNSPQPGRISTKGDTELCTMLQNQNIAISRLRMRS